MKIQKMKNWNRSFGTEVGGNTKPQPRPTATTKKKLIILLIKYFKIEINL